MTGVDTHDPARLLTALDQALADLQDMTDQRDALHAQLARTRPPRRAPLTPPPGPDLDDVAAWVDTWLCTHVEVQLGSRNRWCRQWRQHPAAALYLGQMYADYSRALTDPKLGMANFIRNSLNYYRGYLFAPDGPFASCDPHRHEPPTMLPPSVSAASAESK